MALGATAGTRVAIDVAGELDARGRRRGARHRRLDLALMRVLRGFLAAGVSPFDPLAFAAMPATLLVTATAAVYFPSRRATRVDPMVITPTRMNAFVVHAIRRKRFEEAFYDFTCDLLHCAIDFVALCGESADEKTSYQLKTLPLNTQSLSLLALADPRRRRDRPAPPAHRLAPGVGGRTAPPRAVARRLGAARPAPQA